MKLTRKEAIEKSIVLWKWLAETGKMKDCYDWEGERPLVGCYLCEYDVSVQKVDGIPCSHCPLHHGCDKGPYDKWETAQTPKTRKKYAALFLEELKALLKGD